MNSKTIGSSAVPAEGVASGEGAASVATGDAFLRMALGVLLCLGITGCAAKPYNVYGICSDTCWLEDEPDIAERLKGCRRCLDRLERERLVCGGTTSCEDKP